MKSKLPVYFANEQFEVQARELAERLGTHFKEGSPEKGTGAALVFCESGLVLTDGELEMKGDLTKMLPRLKKNNLQQEMLIKAAKIKTAPAQLTAVDATAGMGEDSLLLAAAGYEVKLYEYDLVIAALLRDSLERAGRIPGLSEAVGRMELFEENSIEALNTLSESPDVVLLDPMFPERQKSALIKKKFQLLQQLEAPCSDENGLLEAAFNAHPKKIVIKRPLKGAYLAGKKPDYSLSGKAIRYDCFVNNLR